MELGSRVVSKMNETNSKSITDEQLCEITEEITQSNISSYPNVSIDAIQLSIDLIIKKIFKEHC